MRALLLMFVMLTSSITIAQDGLYLVFDCDRPLRLERIADIEALGDSDVFARVAVTSNPKTTTTSIFNKYAFAYNKSEEGHLEDWDETTTYADYFQDLSDRVDGQLLRNERIVILETAFDLHSTASVTIYLGTYTNVTTGLANDRIVFDGGTFSVDIKLGGVLEDLSSTIFTPSYFQALWPTYISTVENNL